MLRRAENALSGQPVLARNGLLTFSLLVDTTFIKISINQFDRNIILVLSFALLFTGYERRSTQLTITLSPRPTFSQHLIIRRLATDV